MTPEELAARWTHRSQAIFAGCYFVAYLGYLFLHPEGELLHWLTLVLIPLAAIAAIGHFASARDLFRSIGLGEGRLGRGLGWVLVIGAAFQVIQLLNSRQRAQLLTVLHEPLGFLFPLAALVLLLATVATTEEVFFRGILQGRLAAAGLGEPAALAIATVAFVLYHVPYAYLNPAWPSAGNLGWAFRLAVGNGALTGVVLGAVYWRTGRNLFAAMLLHAFIDLVPAIGVVHTLITGAA